MVNTHFSLGGSVNVFYDICATVCLRRRTDTSALQSDLHSISG